MTRVFRAGLIVLGLLSLVDLVGPDAALLPTLRRMAAGRE